MRSEEILAQIERNKHKALATIGIDPDCEKNGLAILENGEITLASVTFPELIDKILDVWVRCKGDIKVIIEGGWLNEGHWHIPPKVRELPKSRALAYAAQMGNQVGRNAETGRKLIEMLEWRKIKPEVVKPLKKYWKGQGAKVDSDGRRSGGGKITHEELVAYLSRNRIVMKQKRTNQDARDAALIAVIYR